MAMSLNAFMLGQVRDEITAALAAHSGVVPVTVADRDVTQLKRENTGLRNRVKDLEERVAKLEEKRAAVPAAAAVATTQTAEVSSAVQQP